MAGDVRRYPAGGVGIPVGTGHSAVAGQRPATKHPAEAGNRGARLGELPGDAADAFNPDEQHGGGRQAGCRPARAFPGCEPERLHEIAGGTAESGCGPARTHVGDVNGVQRSTGWKR